MLLNPTAQDIEYLTNLISNRIDQGRGETLFEIGLEGKSKGSSYNTTHASILSVFLPSRGWIFNAFNKRRLLEMCRDDQDSVDNIGS